MSANLNSWVPSLLSWRGEDIGGVRVPFYGGGVTVATDMGVLETPLIKKLRVLARDVAAGRRESPRLIFLIGGPGNGKSQAVEEFLLELDSRLELTGRLVELLEERFQPDHVVPRVVEVTRDELESWDISGEVLPRLVIIHDASAMNEPGADAAEHLVAELSALAASDNVPPVFLCCINRGVLARAASAAHRMNETEVGYLLKDLVEATSQVPTGAGAAMKCWPLEGHGEFARIPMACWPMDSDTLLGSLNSSSEDESSIVEQIVDDAVRREKWEGESACRTCDSGMVCPFRQNATWLRDQGNRHSLLRLLRLSELTTRQRWNFRNVFTLVAELLVGAWSDFGDVTHPCEWVHEHHAGLESERGADQFRAARALVARLYPHALFPAQLYGPASEDVRREASDRSLSELVLGIDRGDSEATARSYVRAFLRNRVSPDLDPAVSSPGENQAMLRQLEDQYSRAVELGNGAWGSYSMAGAERAWLHVLREAEQEWDTFDRASAIASRAVGQLRSEAAIVAKRSIGVRAGRHAGGEYLEDYIRILRDEKRLEDLVEEVIGLFGEDGQLRFDAVATYGQARAEGRPFVRIQAPFPLEEIIPAPAASADRPAHDLPFMRIAGQTLPVTFELYRALRLRRGGAPEGSLSASIQAVLDRIRHAYAGRLCRDDRKFRTKEARYFVGSATLAPARDESVRVQKGRSTWG